MSSRRSPARGLSPLAAAALMFALCCGGPYGLEAMVPSVGPGLTIAVLSGMGFVWAAPYALLTAELASAMPEQGGTYRWCRQFLSPFWSFQVSMLDWITWILDAAIYPPLLAAYVLKFFLPGASERLSWMVCLILIWGCTLLNIRGVVSVGRFSILLSVIVLFPLMLLIGLGIPHISLATLKPFVAGGVPFKSAFNLALLFAVWNYSGYGGLAYAGGEVEDGSRNYPRVIAMVLPVTAAVYVLPLWIGLGVVPGWQEWQAGQFNSVGSALGGVWLAGLILIGSQCGNLLLFNSELMITSRLPAAMEKDSILPEFFGKLHPHYGTPARFLIIQAIFYSILTYYMGFTQLVVVSTWVALPTYLLTFAAPIILRIQQPDFRGHFRIPGGWPVLIPCALVPTVIVLYVLVTTSANEILTGLAFMAVPPVLYGWSYIARRTASPD